MVFPNDYNPVHVHVYKNGASVKIETETLNVMGVEGRLPKPKEVKQALKLAKKHKEKIEAKWRELYE